MRAHRCGAHVCGVPLCSTQPLWAPSAPCFPGLILGLGSCSCGSPLAHGEVAGSGFGVAALLCAGVDTDGGVCAAPGAQGRMRGSGLGSAAGSFRASFPGHRAGRAGSSDPAAPHRELWGCGDGPGGPRGMLRTQAPALPAGAFLTSPLSSSEKSRGRSGASLALFMAPRAPELGLQPAAPRRAPRGRTRGVPRGRQAAAPAVPAPPVPTPCPAGSPPGRPREPRTGTCPAETGRR